MRSCPDCCKRLQRAAIRDRGQLAWRGTVSSSLRRVAYGEVRLRVRRYPARDRGGLINRFPHGSRRTPQPRLAGGSEVPLSDAEAADPPRFRTIQVCPKDLRHCPWQAEHAADRLLAAVGCWYHEGTEEVPNVLRQAARLHHVARQRGGWVAARGARAAAGPAGDRVPQQRFPCELGLRTKFPANRDGGRFLQEPKNCFASSAAFFLPASIISTAARHDSDTGIRNSPALVRTFTPSTVLTSTSPRWSSAFWASSGDEGSVHRRRLLAPLCLLDTALSEKAGCRFLGVSQTGGATTVKQVGVLHRRQNCAQVAVTTRRRSRKG